MSSSSVNFSGNSSSSFRVEILEKKYISGERSASRNSSSPEEQTLIYIQNNLDLLSNGAGFYIKPKVSGLPRAIAISPHSQNTKDESTDVKKFQELTWIVYNKKKEGDPCVQGGHKTVTFAKNLATRDEYISSTIKVSNFSKNLDVLREISTLKSLKGEDGFVQLVFYLAYKSKDVFKYRLFFEKCNKGDLCDYAMQTYTTGVQIVSDIRSIFDGLVRKLSYLHNKLGIMHLDIKLENVFLHRDSKGVLQPIIGDFATAVPINSSPSELIYAGTLFYTPPECATLGIESFSKFIPTPKVDVWCLGCTLFSLLTGKGMPWSTHKVSPSKICDSIASWDIKSWRFQTEDRKSPYYLVGLMLEKDPAQRITMSEAEAYLDNLDWSFSNN